MHAVVKFRYHGTSYDSSGVPTENYIIKDVRATIVASFSDAYYNDRGRTQRGSLNLRVSKCNKIDFAQDSTVYDLLEVEYKGKIYKVENVLIDKEDSRRNLLDCQFIRYV